MKSVKSKKKKPNNARLSQPISQPLKDIGQELTHRSKTSKHPLPKAPPSNLFHTLNPFKKRVTQRVARKSYRNAKAYGTQSKIPKHMRRPSSQTEQSRASQQKTHSSKDPYCTSNVDIIDASHNKALHRIHQQRRQCDENPFLSPAFCKTQTDQAVDTVVQQTNRERDKTQIVQQLSAKNKEPFVYPGTPDTEANVNRSVKDDKEFYTKWSDCFAGPRHSSCSCNFVTRNEKNPKASDCEYGKTISKETFNPQQRLVAEYIHPKTPYRGLLCYHGLGSGKTLAMIGILSNFIQHEPARTILILVHPKLIQNFYDELNKTEAATLFGNDAKRMTPKEKSDKIRKYVNVVSFEKMANRLNGMTQWDLPVNLAVSAQKRMNQFSHISGMGLSAIADGVKQPDTPQEPLLNNTLLFIDEAHDLVTPEKAKYPPPDKAYSVLNAMRHAEDCRVVLMTATPMRDDPYELGVLLNMLKPPQSTTKFPEVYTSRKMNRATVNIVNRKETKALFDKLFLHKDANGFETIQNEALFLEKCKGVVSYYPIDNLYTKFPKKHEHLVEVNLSDDVFATVREKMNLEQKALEKHGEYPSILDHKNRCETSRKASNILGHTKKLVSSEVRSKAPQRTNKIDKVVETIAHRQAKGKQFVYSFF